RQVESPLVFTPSVSVELRTLETLAQHLQAGPDAAVHDQVADARHDTAEERFVLFGQVADLAPGDLGKLADLRLRLAFGQGSRGRHFDLDDAPLGIGIRDVRVDHIV